MSWLARIVFVTLALALMAGGFFYWQMTQRETQTPEAVAPPGGRFIDAAGTQLFVLEAGPAAGPAVVLIPGTGAWGELWRATIDALSADGHRVIAIDMPPFGFSQKLAGPGAYTREAQARRIIGVLDALKLDQVVLIGHSVGARPTLEVALTAPRRVARLVLVDPALNLQLGPGGEPSIPRNDPSILLQAVFAAPAIRDTVLAGYATNPWFTKRLFSSFVSRKEAVTEERVRILQQPLAIQRTTPAYGDWMHALMVSPDGSLGADLTNFKRLSMPVLLVWGRDDTVTPLQQGEALERL
ncbi:MAG TPA: alpha/beta hydrolase, partial [Burkholderiales bacterium]|nr:alpha/beta hydrolase [Burkholderiales bacterium]